MIIVAKFFLRCLLRLLYGVKVSGLEHYETAGNRVLIVANHSSLLDGVLLYAWLPETPTFAINTKVSSKRAFRPLLKFVDLFIMDPTSPLSVKSMIKFIRGNKKAVIFPEGRITVTGTMMKIYEGPGLVADKADATVLPVSIDGAHLTPFSYMRGRGRIAWFPRITIKILPPEKLDIPAHIQGHARRKATAIAMQNLMFKLFYSGYNYQQTIFSAVLEAAGRYQSDLVVLEDMTRGKLTYKQLIARTFILSSALRHETEKSERVGILMPNVSGTVITFLAMLYLDRVPAMLNYTAGTQAIYAACKTARLKKIFTSRAFIDKAGLHSLAEELETHFSVIYLEDLRPGISIFAKLTGLLRSSYPALHYRRFAKRIDPKQPAVILFTSGSEGIPKGVVLSHENILANFAQVRCHIHFLPSDIVFSCLPLFHSFGLNAGCLMPLLGGSKTFLYPTPLHYRIIPELIYELGATILFGTNTFFKGYAHHAHPYDFNTLRYTIAGAEKLQDDTVHLWMEKFGIRILQGYGVTEASPVISVNTPVSNKAGRAGQLVPGMSCYIAPVDGIDEGGRLVVKGPNIMLGYLLHDTDGRIIPPATERGPGWYDTGDIATVDEDGFISILGRAKRFAKIAGEMVSLAVVEELAMHTWPDFCHAAVNLPDDRKGEKIVLVTDHHDATRKELQEKARQLKYGEIYIPRKVVLADELPVLNTGKTDYITLTEMALAEDQEGSGWISRITGLVKKTDKKTRTESHR